MEPFQVNSASSKDHQCNCCQLLSPRQHSVLQKWDLAKRNRLFSRTAAGIILRIASKSLMGSSVGSPKFWEGQKFGGGQNVWLCTSNSMFVCDAASQSTKWLDMLKILGTSSPALPLATSTLRQPSECIWLCEKMAWNKRYVPDRPCSKTQINT